ncbi:MAG: anti-sigma factor antagonist, partial [Pseudonocardiales bacterium]|nr:anti-sigma factor antagonist [Pseudonocardiales bacterium]
MTSDFSTAEPDDAGTLAVSVESAGEAAIVAVTGEIDALTVGRLREAIDAGLAQASSPRVVLDLSGVSFLASSGLAALVEGATDLGDRGGWLRVVAGSQRAVVRALEVTGLD